jgi:hypothetical protein
MFHSRINSLSGTIGFGIIEVGLTVLEIKMDPATVIAIALIAQGLWIVSWAIEVFYKISVVRGISLNTRLWAFSGVPKFFCTEMYLKLNNQ